MTVVVDGPVAPAVVDPARLEQAITNLVGNARRFARRQVQVTVGTDGDEVIVTVADDGPGFSPALLPVAFDRFTRADAARGHDAGAGAGLGLAIVDVIVRAHSGTTAATNGPAPRRGGSGGLPVDDTGPIREPE